VTQEDQHPQDASTWSVQEDAALKRNFREGLSCKELSRRHCRSPDAIRARLDALGMLYLRNYLPWSRAEDSILGLGWARGLTYEELSERHLRGFGCIAIRSAYLGWIRSSEAIALERAYEEWNCNPKFDEDQLEQAQPDVMEWPTLPAVAEPRVEVEDWGDSFDDLDAKYWENYLTACEDD
jgi:hypothetical protein